MTTYTSRVVRHVDRKPSVHDYGIRRSTWIRAMALMNRFGSERALELADQRADRSFERGDLATCRRWRDLMVAIHAVEMEEPSPGDRIH